MHDLSCQFGAKGFTKEMRQIAGGSQSGLKKFLSQYPSLFVIDGDYVYVSAYSSVPVAEEGGCKYTEQKKRDYAAEAVEYFRDKMLQYGVGTEVPIKSLLGHRSQASPEVRHISGQRLPEFRDFLLKFPDAFIVRDEAVILKEYEHIETQPFRELEHVAVDEILTTQLIDFFTHCVEIKGPLLVEQMFQSVSSNFPEDSWNSMFKTPQDLATFLKMNSDVFHVQSNLVTLVKTTKQVKEKNNNAAKPSLLLGTPLPPLSDNTPTNLVLNLRQSSPTHAQTLKQRINSLVVKTLAQNSTRERAAPITSGMTDQWRSQILSSTRILNGPKEGLAVSESLMSEAVIGVDLEGVSLGVNGQATLLQVATLAGQVYIFDLLTCPELILNGGLANVLTSDRVVKV